MTKQTPPAMTPEHIELLPCPFCGGTDIKVFEADDIGGWLVGCCAQTWGDTEAEAITAWNTRSPPPVDSK